MASPALPKNSASPGNDPVPGAESPTPFEDRLKEIWDKNRSVIFAGCAPHPGGDRRQGRLGLRAGPARAGHRARLRRRRRPRRRLGPSPTSIPATPWRAWRSEPGRPGLRRGADGRRRRRLRARGRGPEVRAARGPGPARRRRSPRSSRASSRTARRPFAHSRRIRSRFPRYAPRRRTTWPPSRRPRAGPTRSSRWRPSCCRSTPTSPWVQRVFALEASLPLRPPGPPRREPRHLLPAQARSLIPRPAP